MDRQDQDNRAFVAEVQNRLIQRGEKIKDDAWGGDLTLAALDRHLPSRVKSKVEVKVLDALGADRSRKHYALAKTFLGIKEQPGPGTHPQIQLMLDLAPSWLDQDDSKTAWCGLFRGYIGHKCGTGMPSAHYRAANWSGWGDMVDFRKPETWVQGDTIIMTRPGGYHVCFFDRLEGGQVWCLGGNQTNAVTIAPLPLSGIVAVRR